MPPTTAAAATAATMKSPTLPIRRTLAGRLHCEVACLLAAVVPACLPAGALAVAVLAACALFLAFRHALHST